MTIRLGPSGVRWESRPILSAAVKLLAVCGPAIAAVVVSLLLGRLLPPPKGAAGTVTWWALFFAAAIATWLVCARLLNRLLPLAALLNLTLLFPDAAPSRFAVLRRKANPHQLEHELRRVQDMGPDAEPGRRAQTILELTAALSIHDSRTRGHSERVRMFTDLLARELRLSQADADRLRWAALLHDIGKLTVAAEILNKPAPPDAGEWEVLHRHPAEGYRLILPLRGWLGPWADAVLDHHERFDGSGYPNRLSAEDISLGGRVVAVADSYETMTAARPYKTPISVTAAREELVRMSGTHFDPLIVRAFLNISLGRLWQTIGISALLAEIPLLAPLAPLGARLTNLGPRAASAVTATTAIAAVILAGVAAPPGSLHGQRPATPRIPVPAQAALPSIPQTPPVAVPAPAPEPVQGPSLMVQAAAPAYPATAAPPPASGPVPAQKAPTPTPSPACTGPGAGIIKQLPTPLNELCPGIDVLS